MFFSEDRIELSPNEIRIVCVLNFEVLHIILVEKHLVSSSFVASFRHLMVDIRYPVEGW